MAYTRDQLKVYLSLSDEQLHTIGHGNLAKHREAVQAWADRSAVVQVMYMPNGEWRDLDAEAFCVPFYTCRKYRIKPKPMVRVTINGKEYSYCPPKRGRRGEVVEGYVVTRNILGGGRYIVGHDRLLAEDDNVRVWETSGSAQKFADILNAMLDAEAEE